jgi:hypothetical protein
MLDPVKIDVEASRSQRVVFSGSCRNREVRPGPCGKLRRLLAGNSVGERDRITRIRAGTSIAPPQRSLSSVLAASGRSILNGGCKVDWSVLPMPNIPEFSLKVTVAKS